MDISEDAFEMREAGFVWHNIGRSWQRPVVGHWPGSLQIVFEDTAGWVARFYGYWNPLQVENELCFPSPVAALAYAELTNWGRP